MIFKSDLIDAINSLSHDLLALSIRISEVERKLEKNTAKKTSSRPKKICDKNCSELEQAIKETAGRKAMSGFLDEEVKNAKKNLTKAKKSSNAKKQPRTKDGKFTKKK